MFGGLFKAGSKILSSVPAFKVPQFKVPSLPKVSLPVLPKISVPKISLPAFKVPSLPKVSPQSVKLGIGAGAGALTGAAVGGLGSVVPKISLPAISLPDVGGAISGTVSGIGSTVSGGISSVSAAAGGLGAGASGLASSVYEKTYASYDDAEKKMESEDPGERLEGFGQYAGTLGFHVLAPVELGNVVSAHAEGRAGDLTLEDYAWAGFDALFLASIPFTGGLGWAARSGIRAAIKGGSVGSKGGKMAIKPLSRLFGALGSTAKLGRTSGTVGKTARVTRPAVRSASRYAAYQKNIASQMATYQKSVASQIKALTKSQKGLSGGLKGLSKASKAPQTVRSSRLGGSLLTAGAMGIGGAGLTALMMGGAGGSDQVTGWDDGMMDPGFMDPGLMDLGFMDPGYYDGSGSPIWDSSMYDIPYDLPADWYDQYGVEGYYPAAYPGGEYMMPLEAYSQDMLDYMPFGEEINQKGIAFPVLLLGVVVVGAGGLYLYKNRAKIGRKIKGGKK